MAKIQWLQNTKKGGEIIKHYDEVYIARIAEKMQKSYYNAMLFLKMGENMDQERFIKRSERMSKCLDFMLWDRYENNKIMDLKKVNRCKDRFCPNCRSVANAIALTKLDPHIKKLIKKGYVPYLATFTVPNVPGESLKDTIDKMQKSFRKFFKWLNLNNSNGFKDRIFNVRACIKSLEITVEKTREGYYHPHFHCMFFIESHNDNDFEKYVFDGRGRTPLSDADMFLSKLWTMAYDGISLKSFKNLPERVLYENGDRNYYVCDIRPIELPGGLYEVFKYAFKDSDIEDYEAFKTVFEAIDGRRLRQGHGELYNLKLECEDEEMELDDADLIETYLELDKKETPTKVTTNNLEELVTTYKDYKKISRFKGSQYIDKID